MKHAGVTSKIQKAKTHTEMGKIDRKRAQMR